MTPSLRVPSPDIPNIVSPDKGKTREEKIYLGILQVLDIRESFKSKPHVYMGPPTVKELVETTKNNLNSNHGMNVANDEIYYVLEEMVSNEESPTDSST